MRACVARNQYLGGRIPSAVGYTDGTLVKIMKPTLEDNVQAYIGRKSFASINALVTCDKRFYVMNIVSRYPGATNDSYIWANSALRRKMIELNEEERCFLLGDSGFPHEPWMLTPFARGEEPDEDTPEMRYNRDFCRDRCTVENTIGLMKQRFRAINDERILHYSPLKACRIIVAVAVLHNLCILAQVPYYQLNADRARNDNFNEWEGENFNELDENYIDLLQAGRDVRQRVVDYLEQMRNQ